VAVGCLRTRPLRTLEARLHFSSINICGLEVDPGAGREQHRLMTSPLTYSIRQAAERLGMSKRWLQGFVQDYPVDKNGTPFYLRLGNRKRFTDRDLERILEANRAEEKERLELLYPRRFKPNKDRPTSNQETMKRLHELLGPKLARAMKEADERRRKEK
jgi:hypothetical protein